MFHRIKINSPANVRKIFFKNIDDSERSLRLKTTEPPLKKESSTFRPDLEFFYHLFELIDNPLHKANKETESLKFGIWHQIDFDKIDLEDSQ